MSFHGLAFVAQALCRISEGEVESIRRLNWLEKGRTYQVQLYVPYQSGQPLEALKLKPDGNVVECIVLLNEYGGTSIEVYPPTVTFEDLKYRRHLLCVAAWSVREPAALVCVQLRQISPEVK